MARLKKPSKIRTKPASKEYRKGWDKINWNTENLKNKEKSNAK